MKRNNRRVQSPGGWFGATLLLAAGVSCGLCRAQGEARPPDSERPGAVSATGWVPPSGPAPKPVQPVRPPSAEGDAPATPPSPPSRPGLPAPVVVPKPVEPAPAVPTLAARTAAPPVPAAVAAGSRPPDGLRDPFWPVGYVPPPPPSSVAEPAGSPASSLPDEPSPVPKADPQKVEMEWLAAEKAVQGTVKGVSRVPGRDGKETYSVWINGKFVVAGDTVTLVSEGKTFRWIVTRIAWKGGPVLARVTPSPDSP